MRQELVMSPELVKLESLLQYLQNRQRRAIYGFERRFYQTFIDNTMKKIEDLVMQQLYPDDPIIDSPSDFMGC